MFSNLLYLLNSVSQTFFKPLNNLLNIFLNEVALGFHFMVIPSFMPPKFYFSTFRWILIYLPINNPG